MISDSRSTLYWFVQLRSENDQAEKARVVERIDAAVTAHVELFNALLDISKLDAGVLAPAISEFPVDQLLTRIETTFVAAAREKGLRLRLVSSGAWIRSDFILLERVLLNLVSNAVRYTVQGGVVMDADAMRASCASKSGTAASASRMINGETFSANSTGSASRSVIAAAGSWACDRRPSVSPARSSNGADLTRRRWLAFCCVGSHGGSSARALAPAAMPQSGADPASGKLVVVIDDDALVLDAMRELLKSWGCSS